MDHQRRQRFADALIHEGATEPCPRCANTDFAVIGESFIPLQPDSTSILIGGPTVRTVLVGCKRCGCVFEHAMNFLLESSSEATAGPLVEPTVAEAAV